MTSRLITYEMLLNNYNFDAKCVIESKDRK